MSEEAESGFFGSFTCLTKISITPPTDSPPTSNSQSTSNSDNSGCDLQNGFLKPEPLYRQNMTSYGRKKARRQKHLKDMLTQKVLCKSNMAGMMTALLQFSTRNSDIIDQSLLERWREVKPFVCLWCVLTAQPTLV